MLWVEKSPSPYPNQNVHLPQKKINDLLIDWLYSTSADCDGAVDLEEEGKQIDFTRKLIVEDMPGFGKILGEV